MESADISNDLGKSVAVINDEKPNLHSLDSPLNTVTIRPNPATDEIQIVGNVIGSVELYNSIGSLLLTVEQSKKTISLSTLPSGTYYARIPTSAGFVVKPFVIIR